MEGSCYNPIHHTELQKREDIAARPYVRIGRRFFLCRLLAVFPMYFRWV